MAAALLRERWRNRNRAPLGPEPDETFRADRRRWISLLDVKLALRMLRKYPGLTLIGGFGITIAIAFGAAWFNFMAVLSGTSLPLDEGDRIVTFENWDTEAYNEENPHLFDLSRWRAQLTSVTQFGAYRNVVENVFSADGPAEPVPMVEMTASGFEVARIPPLLGRTLLAGDEQPGAPPVIVIGYDVWRSRFGADPDVVGKEMQLGATRHTIVGVMPEGFAFPINHRYWLPFTLDPDAFEPGQGPTVAVFARLVPGAALESLRAELAAVGQAMAAGFPRTHALLQPRVKPFAHQDWDTDDYQAMAFMHSLILLILLVVCTNVAILVYARTATRAQELAIRTALGAGRKRIVGQLFVEALVLSLGASAAGLAIAATSLNVVEATQQAEGTMPFWMDFGLSPGTIIYALTLAVLGAFVVGVIPALQATGRRVHQSLQRMGSGSSRMRLGGIWTGMIVIQVAVAVAVMPAATYMAWDFVRHGLAEPGFGTEQFLSARLVLGDAVTGDRRSVRYQENASTRYGNLQRELLDELTADPRVRGVAYGLSLPGKERGARLEVDEGSRGLAPQVSYARLGWVDVDFFDTFEIPILAGRSFRAGDLDSGAVSILVNESFVQRFLGAGNALGRRVRDADLRPDPTTTISRAGLVKDRWYEVVGVVPDFPNPLDPEAQTARMYRPLAPGQAGPVTLSIRVAAGDPASFGGRLRELAVALDPTLRLDNVRPLDVALGEDQILYRLTAIAIIGAIGSVLLLSAAGIYALMSFTVTRRRREIGIRTALGADRRHLLLGVFRKALVQLASGVAIGVVVVVAAEWYTHGEMLQGYGTTIVPLVAGCMVVVGLTAALGPARRGLAIEPTEALRSE